VTLDEFLADGEGNHANLSRGECRLYRAYSLPVAIGYGKTHEAALAHALEIYDQSRAGQKGS
jgi:hypothetical protein